MEGQKFGGLWTERKLEKVKKYLDAYMKIMKNRTFFEPLYIDAFAGTGYREIQESHPNNGLCFDDDDLSEMENYREGSAALALHTEPSFSRYYFIEKDKGKCQELLNLKTQNPQLSEKITVINRDANESLLEMCSDHQMWKKGRAVLFLDPFGMQVDWSTIEAIASTQAIDLWYLFSISAVNRLLQREGCTHAGFAARLDKVFGTHEWEKRFYKRSSSMSLFEEEPGFYKSGNFEEIAAFLIERLNSIFAGVSEKSLIMKNSKQSPMFMLCFAVGNPKAVGPALKIANHLLKD